MDTLILLLTEIPGITLGFLFFILSIVLYLFFYIYMNVNLRGILKIIFADEGKFARPLEPFNFIFLSMLPTTFWREVFNIKFNKFFKKVYGKEFYYSIDENQLRRLLLEYKAYFVFQYLIFISTTFGIVFLVSAYILDKYF